MIGSEAAYISGITSLLKSLARDIIGYKEAQSIVVSPNVPVVNLPSKYLFF